MKEPKKIFRSNLSSDQTNYIAWFERLETEYDNHWKMTRIFDLLQLSKLNIQILTFQW